MWNNITIMKNQIEHVTDRAVLIKMPSSSKYPNFVFWHPAKLVRKKGKMMSFSFNNEFKFKIMKYGQGRYNFTQVVDEIEIDYKEMEEAFSKQENAY